MEPINKNTRIVLIGGSGFLGRNLAVALLREGYSHIVIVSRHAGEELMGLEYAYGYFADFARMREVLMPGDIVVHLACSSVPATSESNRAQDIEENLIGTIRLLEVCVEKNIRKFIFASSGGTVYGNHGEIKLSEDTACVPMNAHGAMKLSIEQYVAMYHRQFGFSYAVLRFGNVYGRMFDPKRAQGVIEIFFAKHMKGESIEIWGDGSYTRDYLYIDDAVEFLLCAIGVDAMNGVYNVGNGVGTTLQEIITHIKDVTGRAVEVTYQHERAFDVPHIILDIEKAKKELGWSPKVSLSEGILMHYERNYRNA